MATGQMPGRDEHGPTAQEAGEQDVLATAATCAGTTSFTAAESVLLAALPEPADPVEPATWCELEAGHGGLHYGLGQISGATWWWLRWSDDSTRREFVDAGFCGMRPAAGNGDCGLPRDHPGRHGFELDDA